jgi:hypothetical protein
MPVLATLPTATNVDVQECDASASWCAVELEGVTGFVSGKYLTETDGPLGWPRSFSGETGASVTLHQPQISNWDDFQKMTALLATEIKRTPDAEPIYGVIEIKADTVADHGANEIIASNIVVSDLSFSSLARDDMSKLALAIGDKLPTDAITLSLARTTASLEQFRSLDDVEGLSVEAPLVYITQEDSILVLTDGEPVTASIENVPDLAFVINTNWDLFSVYDTQKWVLRSGNSWLEADELTGPWTSLSDLPAAFSELPDNGNWDDAIRAISEGIAPLNPVPAVYYSDVPAEMISIDGEPAHQAVPGTDLDWISNTEFDLFYHKTEEQWYFLTSGRWFRSETLEGEWSFATPDLPADFRKIPDDTNYYTVRASVPGTPESDEARLIASIPEMAAVEIGSITAEVSYSGEPAFTPIEGTEMSYALNSTEPVILVAGKYFTVIDGIWFVSDSPDGPFEIATSVPDEIYTIPATEPVHNVTYVKIYETTDTHVHCGVTAGFFFGYIAWNTFFYGSGWYYPPYWNRPGWGYRPPYVRPPHYRPPGYRPPHVRPPIGSRPPGFHPRPVTYGIGGYYDPARGKFGRYGKDYGPDRGLSVKPKVLSKEGGFKRNAHVTPAALPLGTGARDFVSAATPRITLPNTANAKALSGAYSSWAGKGVTKGRDIPATREALGASGRDVSWSPEAKKRAQDARASGGKDLIAGQDGKVYRQNNGKWEQNDGGKWQGVQKPEATTRPATKPQVNRPATTRPATQPQATRPATTRPTTTRPPANVPSTSINRQRGNQRSIQQRSVQPQRSRPSGGGGARGGGGGRRR